ncbi:MAG: 16S rRNA (cytosine(967)-C(5))-methyltransferase RsmB [Actinomycetota bacterium]
MSASARSLALAVIRRVTEHGGYSTLALSAALRRSGLPARDRDLAAELVYGTLRRIIPLDWAIERHTERSLARASGSARALLRLGAYQLLFTRIPDHAAVGETVALASGRERGFLNAVLRRLAAETPTWPGGDGDGDVSIRTGLTTWAVRDLRRLVGDEVEDAARALATAPPMGLRTNTCRISSEDLERALSEAGIEVGRGTVHRDTLLVRAAVPQRLPGWNDGWFTVQDEASAFVVGALDPLPGERVLDACAAPGGKATHVACLVGGGGLTVAADAMPKRAGLINGVATRLGVPVRVLAQDARRPALRGAFDRVLVDAPCSGLGAARRRPELLWRPRRDNLSHLARLQVAIVSSVAELLRPGGRLVYSVCTFPRAETDAACDAILRHRPDLEPVDIAGPDGPAPRIRLWPHLHGTDAMFVAAFRRMA